MLTAALNHHTLISDRVEPLSNSNRLDSVEHCLNVTVTMFYVSSYAVISLTVMVLRSWCWISDADVEDSPTGYHTAGRCVRARHHPRTWHSDRMLL